MTSAIDSNDATRYIWWQWRFVGINPFKKLQWLYWCYSAFLHVFFYILDPVHVLLTLAFTNDLRRILGLLTIGLSMVFATIKQLLVQPYVPTNFVKAQVHLVALDAYAQGSLEEQELIRRMVRFCQRLYIFYTCAFCCSLSAFIAVALIRHQTTFEGWFPFDWHTSELYYAIAMTYQILAAIYQISQNIANDAYPPIYLSIMVTHARLLNMRIARLGADASKSFDEHNKALLRCIGNHKEFLGLYECIRPIISRTMFAQFMTTGFILCVTAAFYLTSNRGAPELLNATVYISLIITEVLPCCWYVNKLVHEQNQMTTAMYSSQWYAMDQRFRKTLIIFMQRSQKATPIMAGNLAPITLQTFLGIIRFSFSMFTILTK